MVDYVCSPSPEFHIDGVDVDGLRWMLRTMMRIREFEERIADLVDQEKIITPCHLYTGQEAVATGVCFALNTDDYIFGTHRSHGHYLAKGGDLKAAMAEIFGRETGCSRGRGGSMHLVSPENGIFGTSSIVAGSMAIAVGTGLAELVRGTGRVTAVFHGDSVLEEGIWHESANFASLKRLPVIFICENNFYCAHMPLNRRRVYNNLHEIAEKHGLDVTVVDGNNVLEVYYAARDAVKRARERQGPSFVECRTYRWRGHVGPNYDVHMGLRSQEEIDIWMERCPIKHFAGYLFYKDILTREEIDKIKHESVLEVNEAISYAMSSPFPEVTNLTKNVYKGEHS